MKIYLLMILIGALLTAIPSHFGAGTPVENAAALAGCRHLAAGIRHPSPISSLRKRQWQYPISGQNVAHPFIGHGWRIVEHQRLHGFGSEPCRP